MHHDHEPPALDRVGERAADDREHEHGDSAQRPSSPTASVECVSLVDLERHDGRDDLVAEVRDRLAQEQQAEVARLAERGEIHEVPARTREQRPGSASRVRPVAIASARTRRDRRRSARILPPVWHAGQYVTSCDS